MRLVILESPFAKPEQETPEHPAFPGSSYEFINYARRATAHCLRHGDSPLVSHLLFTQAGILDDRNENDRRLGIDAGTAWLHVADALVVYTDHGFSKGMKHRIELAHAAGMRVELREIGK